MVVIAAPGKSDQSWGTPKEHKLLTPIQDLLSGVAQNPAMAAPFDAESLYNVAKPLVKIRSADAHLIGPIQIGPLVGSQHKAGAKFYFPAPREKLKAGS